MIMPYHCRVSRQCKGATHPDDRAREGKHLTRVERVCSLSAGERRRRTDDGVDEAGHDVAHDELVDRGDGHLDLVHRDDGGDTVASVRSTIGPRTKVRGSQGRCSAPQPSASAWPDAPAGASSRSRPSAGRRAASRCGQGHCRRPPTARRRAGESAKGRSALADLRNAVRRDHAVVRVVGRDIEEAARRQRAGRALQLGRRNVFAQAEYAQPRHGRPRSEGHTPVQSARPQLEPRELGLQPTWSAMTFWRGEAWATVADVPHGEKSSSAFSERRCG